MKVLFLSNEFPGPHDPGRAVFNLRMCQVLAAAHDVRVVSPVAWRYRLARRHPDPEETRGLRPTYPTYYFPPRMLRAERGRFMWWSIRRHLASRCAQWRPDVVLSYWAHPDGETALRFARQLGVPFVQIVGGSDVLVVTRDPRRRARVRSVLQSADAVVTMGRHLADRVMELGVPGQRIFSMYRPVDDRCFTPGSRLDARQRLGLDGEGALLLWVGRFVPVKSVDTLIHAVATIRKSRVDVKVALVGTGPDGGAARALVNALGLQDVVHFAGPVAQEQLVHWYRAANITVLPSASEGVPNVLLESIACGVPFVASRVGGIPEIADPDLDRLVPPGRPDDLANAVTALLRPDVPLRERRVLPAAPATFMRQLDEVFDQVTKSRVAVPLAIRTLRAATLRNPSRSRQAVRQVLSDIVPRSMLLTSGQATTNQVCLTFDDGPHSGETAAILDTLRRHAVKATFFVQGSQAAAHPDLIRRMREEGHDVGHHSWSHGRPEQTSSAALAAEVVRTRAWLQAEVGIDSRLFRPPHGKLTAAKLLRLWTLGQTIVLWNLDPGDVFQKDTAAFVNWLDAHPPAAGDIVLLHDRSPVLAEALPHLISLVRTRNLEFATISDWVKPLDAPVPAARAEHV